MTDGSEPAPSAAALPLAQTSVELFEQLQRRGTDGAGLRRVRAAYGAAMLLFAGRMHPCGKPYLAHCAGAASALAGVGAAADLVAAALLHAAYRWGDFGPWCVGLPLKRRRVRRILGGAGEQSVYRFHTLPWNAHSCATLAGTLHGLEPDARGAVLLRLASELDNASDHSLWYRADAAERAAVMQRTAPALVDMAAELGFPVLGLALSAAIETSGQGYLPAELRWRHFGVASFPPASARRRGAALLGQAIGALVRRLRHGRGAT